MRKMWNLLRKDGLFYAEVKDRGTERQTFFWLLTVISMFISGFAGLAFYINGHRMTGHCIVGFGMLSFIVQRLIESKIVNKINSER